MKKSLLWLLVMMLAVSIIATFSLAGCKEEEVAEEEVAEEEVVEEEVAEEEVAEEEVAEETMTEEEWIASLKNKWPGVELSLVSTAFCMRPEIDEAFMELTGATIKPTTFGMPDLKTKIVTTLSAKSDEGMDIMWCGGAVIGTYIDNGWYVPMQDMIFESDKEDVLSSFADCFISSDTGDMIALPFLGMPYLLFYNETILKEAGYNNPPKNWDELRSMSMDIVDKGLVKYAITWPLWTGDPMSSETWGLVLTAMGGKWVNEDGSPAFNTDIGLRAMDYFTDSMYVDKWASPTSIEVEKVEALQPFLQGENAFNLTWQFMWPRVTDPEQSSVVEDAKFALVPYTEGVTVSSWLGLGAWTVNPYSENIDAAKDYCRYFASHAVAFNSFKGAVYLPMWKSFYEDPQATEIEPDLDIILDALDRSTLMPPILFPWYTEAEEIMRMELSKGWTGESTNKEALDNTEARWLKRMSENWE